MDFAAELFKRYMPKMVGMDLTEVNFELTEGNQRLQDEQTFKDLFEFLVYQAAESSVQPQILPPRLSQRVDEYGLF